MLRWAALATPARPAWATLVTILAAVMLRWARRLYGLLTLTVTDAASPQADAPLS